MNLSAVIGYGYEEECCEAWLQESSWSRLVLTPNNRRNNCNKKGNWIDTCFNSTSKKIANKDLGCMTLVTKSYKFEADNIVDLESILSFANSF